MKQSEMVTRAFQVGVVLLLLNCYYFFLYAKSSASTLATSRVESRENTIDAPLLLLNSVASSPAPVPAPDPAPAPAPAPAAAAAAAASSSNGTFPVRTSRSRLDVTRSKSMPCSSSPAVLEREVIVLGDNEPTHTTIVSAYFDFSNNGTKSHPNWQFLAWLGQFLRSCEGPLVMFTDVRTASFIQESRLNSSYRTILLVYDSIWTLMHELEVKRNQSYRFNYEHVQLNLSLPELYAIWNLKPYITQRVVDMNPYKSRFFIYNDAGAWRDWETREWPDNEFVKQVEAKIGDRMLLGQLHEQHNGYHCWHAVVEGGFFAGTAKAVAAFDKAYYDIHDASIVKTDKNEQYVGKCSLSIDIQNQTCLNVTSILR